MINSILLLGLIHSAATADPAVPELRVEEQVIEVPQMGPLFPEILLPMIMEYDGCLHPGGGLQHDPVTGYPGALRARMKDCRGVRDWAISSATRVYKRNKDQPGTLVEQVTQIFDDHDQTMLANAKYIDDQLQAQVGLPPRTQPDAQIKNDDAKNN